MSTKSDLFNILNTTQEKYLSGQELATQLGLSRNAVWKAVKSLQDQGFEIESKSGVGYRLVKKNDILSSSYIKDECKVPCRVIVLNEVDSTSNYAKTLSDLSVPNIIIADTQTAGRGRLGRSFYSPQAKGLYMSIVFEPKFSLDKSMLVSSLAALSVCKAFEEVTGLGPKIKWVNDIYLNNRKVCGILTEAETNFETGSISRIIVGIGVNCFEQTFPEEIRERAGYIQNPHKEFTRNRLASAIIKQFFDTVNSSDKRMLLREYKSRSLILGKPILVYGTSYSALPENGGHGIRAKAVDIDDNGGLVIEYTDGIHAREMDTITSGEVTIRKDWL